MSVAVSEQGSARVGPAAVQPSRGSRPPLLLVVRGLRRLGLVSLLPGLLLGSVLVAAPFAGTSAVDRPAPALATPAAPAAGSGPGAAPAAGPGPGAGPGR